MRAVAERYSCDILKNYMILSLNILINNILINNILIKKSLCVEKRQPALFTYTV